MRRSGGLLLGATGGMLAVVLAACSGSSSTSVMTVSDATRKSPLTTPSGDAASAGQLVPAPVEGTTTLQAPVRTVTPPAGIDGLLAWSTKGYPGTGTPQPGALQNSHVPGPVRYQVTPPVGGPHHGIWMNAGVYTVPVPSEPAVHLMEHGAVWVTYRPNLPADQVAALTTIVAKQSMVPENASGTPQANRYLVMSPWASNQLPAPVVISSWGYQLRLDDPADSRLQAFADTFRNSRTYSPEFGSPMDGVPVLTGGNPASNGSALPNPPGAVPAS